NRIVSASLDKTLRLWESATGKCLCVFKGHVEAVNSVAFSPDGKLVLSGSVDKTLRLWNVANGRCLRTINAHREAVSSVAFSPDGRYFVSGSQDKTVRLWEFVQPAGSAAKRVVLRSKDQVGRTGTAAAVNRPADDFPVATDIRVVVDDMGTRMVVDFSREVEIKAFMLANPDRVVIDMPQVVFQFRPEAGETGCGLIKAFRFGLVIPGHSRIVIDLSRPARIISARVLESGNGQPARLMLDLTALDREAFMRLLAL